MIRIPNRVIALVLAVTMLLSATSLTTFADDSDYIDSRYTDSGRTDSDETDKSYDEVDGLADTIKLQPRMFMMASAPPDNYEYFTHFAPPNKETQLTQTWTVPSTGTYKVHVIGAGGDGGDGQKRIISKTGSFYRSTIYRANGGGAGGNGGLAISELYLTQGQQVQININSEQSIFNNALIANAGKQGTKLKDYSFTKLEGDQAPADVTGIPYGGKGGTASGGNKFNITGIDGGQGGFFDYDYYNNYTGYGGNVAIDTNATAKSNYYTNTDLKGGPRISVKTWSGDLYNIGQPGASTPIGAAPNVKFGGGGSGGSGGANYHDGNSPGGKGGAGQVGGIVIEKLKLSPPTVSQNYDASTNKVTITATSPEAERIEIINEGTLIISVNSNSINYDIAANGRYVVKAIKGTDEIGVYFEIFDIDDFGPEISHTQPPSGWARSKSIMVTLVDVITQSGMQYQINGGDWTNYTAPFNYEFATNGSITVNARDKWGNPSSTTTITANQIDTTPPTPPTITKTPPKPWHKDNVTVTISGGTDAGSGVKGYQYQIDGGKWQDYTAPFAVDKSAKINARTVDNVGLVSQPTTADVNIDRIKPTGAITYNKAWTNGSVELTFTATDLGGAGVQHVRPAGGTWTDGDTIKHFVTTNGTHSFEVEDCAGNPETVSEEISNIDKVLPIIKEINFAKENDDIIQSILHFFNKQVSVYIKASDDASGVDKIEYQLIEKGNTIKEDGWLLYNVNELPKVSRRFSGMVAVHCTDVATNISAVKEEPVTVEDTPPTATHTLSTTDWTDGTVTIRLNAKDDLSGVATITLPDGTVIDGDTADFTVSTNGTYRFIIADKCGNILNYDVEVKKIDLTPCTATHTLNPIGYTNGRVKITIFAEDKESGVKSITLPDGTVVDGNTASYTVDSNDTYTFKLTNNAGTTSGYVVMVDKIDKTNPTITKFELRETQDSPVNQFFRSILPNTNMFRKQVELIVEAEDDHSGVNKIEYQAVPKGSQVLDSGWKTYHGGDKPSRLKKDMDATVYVRSLDNATNISAVVSKDAIIDGTAPTATYTLSTSDWTKDGIDITVKTKDNIVGVASITLPDGTVVDGDTATYHVTRNGVYTFILTDKLGTSCDFIVTVSNIEEQLPTPPKTEPQPTDPNQPDELELEWSKAPEELDVKAEAPSGIAKYQYRVTKRANPMPPASPDEKLPNKAKVLGTFVTDWLECNGKITVTDEGIFDVNVRSVSVAGNVSPVSKYTVKNDFTPPTITYYTTRNSIELKAEDNLSGVAKIVCEHGEVLGSEVSCPMKRTEDHVYTVTDDAGNPTVVTVEFKRRSNPSKPDYEPPLETGDTTAKPDKPHPHEPTPSEQQTTTDNSTPAEASEVDAVNSLPDVPEQTKPNDTAPTEPKEKTDSAYQIIVQLLSDFVRNTAKVLQKLWSWLVSLPMLLCIGVISLWFLLLALIIYLIYQKVKENKKKKADKQD